MSNILHKFTDKISGNDENSDTVDERGNRLNSQQQSHGRTSDMGNLNQPSSGLGMGRGSQQNSAGRYDDDQFGGRQTRSKNKIDNRTKDHYDEYDDDFNTESGKMGGRQHYSTEQRGYQVDSATNQGIGTQGGISGQQGFSGQGVAGQGIAGQGIGRQTGTGAHVPGTPAEVRDTDWSKNAGRKAGTQTNNEFSNSDW